MANEIVSYIEMCLREGISLQKGMNFGVGGTHSVILMSLRPDAPYQDQVLDSGSTLVYEGHDIPRTVKTPRPKAIDQPEFTSAGSLTENGKFHQAAQSYKKGERPPERVRAYEKIRPGIWSYNGVFHLVDSWRERVGVRTVFRFKLKAVEGEENFAEPVTSTPRARRIIPTAVKLEVWKRDGGRCVVCEATDDLHFDHDIPYSKGGSSLTARNVQLLCARHNLEKSDRIK